MKLDKITEADFLKLYADVVERAKQALGICNAEREEPGDWPAGQEWDDLSSTSKSTFMRIARAAMGINHDEFLGIVRNWPHDWSPEGQDKLEDLFGT